ncbi:hypothetical protein DPMN_032162, partial [Dreissena polymorpha]
MGHDKENQKIHLKYEDDDYTDDKYCGGGDDDDYYHYDDNYACWNQILKAFANGFDPDETPQNVASHQDPN